MDPSPPPAGGPPPNETVRLLAMLRLMLRIRAFEREAVAAMRSGEAPGVVHASIGQEAIAAGVCLHLRREDRVTSTHRGHGHALAKGADARAMMLELYGRAGGACGGKGGSMHIADFAVGMLGANGVVGAGIPIACGAAQGLRLLRQDAVVACFFGDGAVNRGPFLEGLNWAALYRLPVLFVCEDNGFAAFTRTAESTAGAGAAARAEAIGVPALAVDGTDPLAVDAAAADLIAAIRAGAGPRLLHARCYRWEGHTGTDPAAYRPAEEVAAARARDPIRRLAEALIARGVAAAEIAALEAEAEAEMRAHREAARAAPLPDPAAAFADVQDTGAPAPCPA
ncbi:thiamine pyrophosphate-dependent dehydrogenase E1 component subunit alpha [Caldovatus aquaticus]|uniref:Thiamine pyrophosphate-dependent dehydrogenase E1 component subunit alpha n=1 Tax=Caldovatus aquaticus TaxID=2865671 RepID=A0ABS7F4P7_9PROT|nr:thiamine pyrophosphate-dependent dehydrogenase E1 component subunit alpha [Caldovatus aquaticus]MBW8270594.1 thiamine pyrophosphate-dependent dehydrogenase E1 component subunit alpha [Caldovatus aquaticus]